MAKDPRWKNDFLRLVDYLNAHPDERLWQALRNWSGFAYIMGSDLTPPGILYPKPTEKQLQNFVNQLSDTFNIENTETGEDKNGES